MIYAFKLEDAHGNFNPAVIVFKIEKGSIKILSLSVIIQNNEYPAELDLDCCPDWQKNQWKHDIYKYLIEKRR